MHEDSLQIDGKSFNSIKVQLKEAQQLPSET